MAKKVGILFGMEDKSSVLSDLSSQAASSTIFQILCCDRELLPFRQPGGG